VPGAAPALGSLPKPGLPEAPGLPGLPVAGLPAAGLPAAPGFPGAPGLLVPGLPVAGLPVAPGLPGAPGLLVPGLPVEPGLPPVPGAAGCPVVPPDPLCLAAAAVVAIGATLPPVAAGAGCEGAPNAGAVVVVVAAAGQGDDPEGAHCAAVVGVVVVVDFLSFFGFGHGVVVGVDDVVGVVEPGATVVVVVDDEPVFPFDFLAVVVAAGAAGAEAAAGCSWVWGTAELPATAGVKPASTAATTVAAANPSRPSRMRDIGTSLFHFGGRCSGLAVRCTGGDGHATGHGSELLRRKGTSCPSRHELPQECVKGSAERRDRAPLDAVEAAAPSGHDS